MNIVAILGSPHGMKGATGSLLTEVIRAAEKAGAQVTTLSLAEHPVKPCCGCDGCHKTGKCGAKDDYLKYQQAMLDADGIILASPNYIFSVSAQMKALLDRCCGPLHLQNMLGKYGAVVVTSGGDGDEEVQQYMLRFLGALGCWTVGGVGAEAAELFNLKSKAEIYQAGQALGTRLVDCIRKKEKFADQAAARDAFFARMKQVVSWRKQEWPFEYEYWKSQGRL